MYILKAVFPACSGMHDVQQKNAQDMAVIDAISAPGSILEMTQASEFM
jgi:hypothetical protein